MFVRLALKAIMQNDGGLCGYNPAIYDVTFLKVDVTCPPP